MLKNNPLKIRNRQARDVKLILIKEPLTSLVHLLVHVTPSSHYLAAGLADQSPCNTSIILDVHWSTQGQVWYSCEFKLWDDEFDAFMSAATASWRHEARQGITNVLWIADLIQNSVCWFLDIRISRVNEKCWEKCIYYFVLANLGLKNTIITYYFFQIKSRCCSSAALIEKPPLITPPAGINNDDSYVKVKP
jgi:hypothetical protein